MAEIMSKIGLIMFGLRDVWRVTLSPALLGLQDKYEPVFQMKFVECFPGNEGDLMLEQRGQSEFYPRLSTSSDIGAIRSNGITASLVTLRFEDPNSPNRVIQKWPGLGALYKETGTLLLNKDEAPQ